MSVKLMAMVFDDYPGPPLEKLTALAVADHADHDGGRIWPTVASLARKTGNSERTVQRHLRQMQERGWLVLVRPANGRGSTAEYRMPLERVKGVTQSPFVTPERVTLESPFTEKKGDNRDTKGCQPRHERVTERANIVCESPTEPSTEPSTTAVVAPKKDFPPEFDLAWQHYPRRAGGNPKPRALKAWRARRRDGDSADLITEGVKRYAKFCRETGKINTEFIMQACTFFGPDKHYLATWATPAPRSPPGKKTFHGGLMSEAETVALGKQHRIEARVGESMDQYRLRLSREIDSRRTA